jgi:dTDP-4-dehydrorhamnose reductase
VSDPGGGTEGAAAEIPPEMTPTILLTGKNGQVGRALSVSLPRVGEVVALDREQLDLSKPDEIRRVIQAVRPTIIVNAAAYTAVDQAESNEAAAQAANADAPCVMAEEAKRIGAALVHFSTDYVFDGAKRAPYVETDVPRPQNVYGRTKLAGEQAIQESGVPHLIFRTAWVYAREGHNFLLTVLRLATQRETLRIVQDQIGAPTWSWEIADATTNILAQICGSQDPLPSFSTVSGLYHMTAAGETSWYNFARVILKEARHHAPHSLPWFTVATNHRPLIARFVSPITTAEYPTPARRPAYSVLSNARLACAFRTYLPDWRMQLRSVFKAS